MRYWKNWTKEELEEYAEDAANLYEKLHELMDDLPPNIRETLWDQVYARFEP